MAHISKRGRKPKNPKKGRPVLTVDQLNRLYQEQKETIESNSLTTESGEVEQWKRCLDKDTFGGRCYCPAYVISSFGRIWSLEKGKNGGLMKPFRSKSKRTEGYWKVKVSESGNTRIYNPVKNSFIHKLVATYFCDLDHEQRMMMIEIGRAKNMNDFEVHHIALNRLLIEDQRVNRWDNLQFISITHHRAFHRLLKALQERDPDKQKRKISRFNKQYGQLFNDGVTLERPMLNAYGSGTNKNNSVRFIYKRVTEEDFAQTNQDPRYIEFLKSLPEGARVSNDSVGSVTERIDISQTIVDHRYDKR